MVIQWHTPNIEISENKSNIVLKLYITPADLLGVINNNFNIEQLSEFLTEILKNTDVEVVNNIFNSMKGKQ